MENEIELSVIGVEEGKWSVFNYVEMGDLLRFFEQEVHV